MKNVEKKVAALLAGTGVIPIKNEWVEELLNGGHVVFTEKAADGESDAEFMRRAFSKVLQNESIVKSTKQCIIFNAPERHGKMSIDEIEQLSGYISKWSVGEAEYIMNWGLYEMPDCKRMKITIVANSSAKPKAIKEEMMGFMKIKSMVKRVCYVIIAMCIFMLASYCYNKFFPCQSDSCAKGERWMSLTPLLDIFR